MTYVITGSTGSLEDTKRGEVLISKKGFKCTYCGKQKKGAYRIVDGERSCEKCNRSYDYRPGPVTIECPVCKQDWRVHK